MERIFELTNLVVLPFWLLMIALPRARVTGRVMRAPWVSALLAAVYVTLVAPRVATLLPLLARPTLASVASLLGTPEGATLAWVHFLAFDLFVGRWMYLDARERGVPALALSPVLLLTLLFGPAGLLAYLGVRAATGRRAQPAVAGGRA